MAVCEQYRVPHSVFLDWSASDRDKAIWWHVRQREACPGCGTRRAEWDEQRGGDRFAYTARKTRCRGCQVAQQEEKTLDPKKDGLGVRVVLEKNPGASGGD